MAAKIKSKDKKPKIAEVSMDAKSATTAKISEEESRL